MYKGYKNRFLEVDLTRRTFRHGTPPPELWEGYLGGKGAGLKLMWDLGLINHDPYAPENPLIFLTGPFTGTPLQTSARSALTTKSPLTGTFLDSHAGGHFGPQLKRAGLDYLFITGAADRPLYLHITPSGVSFEDASGLWGRGIFDTEAQLREKYPDSRVASIGPAGENRVRFACIGTELYRQYGRGGAGAVMGAKNLKAIVVEGNEKIDYHDRDGFIELNKALTKDVMEHPNRKRRFELGTNMWIRMGQEDGRFLPTRNFRDVQFEGYEGITSEKMREKLGWKSVGCQGCGILCSKEAVWEGKRVEGPEYETTAFLGSGCGIGSAEAVAEANRLCDDLGLDTISAGVVMSFAMEAFEKGVLTSADTGGIPLDFGNAEAQQAVLGMIARREGVGDVLAEGSRLAARQLGKGSEYFAIQTAGMELSGVNIKGCASMGLALATADFASHTRCWSATAEMKGLLTFENTPDWVKLNQDGVNTRNSLIVCDFLMYDLDRLAPLFEKLTGMPMTDAQLQKTGEKLSNLNRMYNMRNGRDRTGDTLPRRFFEEKHLAGIFEGQLMTEEKFGEWLDLYYASRGWDARGIPTAGKLEELGLGFAK
jgi:aldehyde:ferredoxin oxidoreductase